MTRIIIAALVFFSWLAFQPAAAAQDPQKDQDWATEEDPWGETESGEEDPWGEEAEEEDPWGEEEEPSAAAPWEEDATEEKSAFSFSGRFWTRLAHDLREQNPYEDDAYNHTKLRLRADYDPAPGTSLVMSIDGDHFIYRNSGDHDHTTSIRPYEFYIRRSWDWLEITLGNQIVRWGKIDQVSPLDIVNPEDLRDGFAQTREERKLPIPMVDLKLFKGMYKFEAVFIPFFQESKLDLIGRDWAMFHHYDRQVGPFEIVEKDLPNDLSHSEYGFRFSGTFKKLDYALSYFRTREDTPSIGTIAAPPGFRVPDPSRATLMGLARTANDLSQPVTLDYKRQHVYGLEFETTWGEFGIRGDFAYIHERYFLDHRLRRTSRPVFHYALGVDYNRPGSYYVNIQFSQQIVRHYESTLLFADEVTNAVNGTLTKDLWDGKLELGLRYLYNFTQDDYYLNPSVTLEYWRNITLELGLDILGGPEESTLGVFEDNDEAYCIFEYHF
ncbi:MAG: DUF1302 family protein [Desulfobacteraceae bacterium]